MLLGDAESCYSEEMAPASHSVTPSLTPSPPPPLPPQASTAARWIDLMPPHCQRCRRYANSYTGSLNKDPRGDEDSCPVICERDMHSLHRAVPALRRRDVDTSTIRAHYYPEGGWGWIVCGAGFLVQLLTSGVQLGFGLLYLYAMRHLGVDVTDAAWLGALSLAVSLAVAPLVGALCRARSPRLPAVLGGLVLALACLFTSFATRLHQALLSYGLLLGAGAGVVREAGSLMLGHYFKRRRAFVEMVVQAGAGVGVALFSVLYKEAVGKLGWRLGLQAVTGVLALACLLGALYRSASLYHPQRRAILHLKNQRARKGKQATAKPPFLDLAPLRLRAVRVLLLAAGTAALGLYTPVFYLALQGFSEGLEDSALVLLQTFLGFAMALGCVGFGLVVVRPSDQCLISRRYLCQAALVGVGVSLLALSAVQGYHGYVLFVWLYGVCLGGVLYSLKMVTMERVRARHFTRAWGFVQGAEALPVLLGVPITGYINQSHPKAGYYFSFLSTMLGAALLFLVGCPRRPPAPPPPPPPMLAPAVCSCTAPRPLPKSISFATTLDLPDPPLLDEALLFRPLRPSKSVPEGLECRRPAVRHVTVIEQMTTSV
ncbi:monocarboxylate transporter 4 isoform X3 [Periplaneta americana]|uniref:monocarboxylate transporter 4 isoform X3 n=1 Tax=Periplaneta americana TaxID=6978 RepID=UPI0037E9735C